MKPAGPSFGFGGGMNEMFKNKLIYKTVAIFVSVTILLVALMGILSTYFVTSRFEKEFESQVDEAVTGGFASALQNVMGSSEREFVKQYEAESLIRDYGPKLGLDENRRCYILAVPGGEVVAPSSLAGSEIEETSNLTDALVHHTKGSSPNSGNGMIDYAYYLSPSDDAAGEYAVYVTDNKTELHDAVRILLIVMLWMLLAGGLLSAAAAVYVSRMVTQPLRKLARRADSFARGVYDMSSDSGRTDEIGTLTKAFNHMGRVMSKTISQMGAEKHKVDVILEHITNGIMAFDTDQKLIHINPAAKEMLGITETEDLEFDKFFDKLGAGVCMAEFTYLDKFSSEIRDVFYGGKHIRIYFVPFKMDNERTAGVVCVFEDFTEQFNLEVARREFVAEVSHELKTPLFIIKTHTETLLNGYLDDKAILKKFLTTIENEADKMTELVRNLLDLSKFDVQKFSMNKQVFSIEDMLRGIVERFSLEAKQKDIKLELVTVGDLPQMYADPEQIERAIVNIVSNSMKYGRKGGYVNVSAGSMYNEVYIKVKDNGYGIPKADLDHVFERFFRVDRARTREKGGTGLGLSIAKEIIESHGGNITIESEYGKFTNVTINLPTATTDEYREK